MDVAIVFGLVIVAVFAGTFLSGRRFGVLAFSLAAGSILDGLWSKEVANILAIFGLRLDALPGEVVASAFLLLMPLILLLLSGPKYQKRLNGLIPAVLVGVLAAAFLVEPLGSYMTLSGESLRVYQLILKYSPYIISMGMVLAITDLWLVHGKKPAKLDKKS